MRQFISLLLSSIMLASLTGCEPEGMIVDWTPVSLRIKVQDNLGNDLLDPNNPNNMIDGTTITFKGETYESSRSWFESKHYFEYEPQTKAYAAILYGLYLVKDSEVRFDGSGYSLLFGQIDGADNMDEELIVTLPDGTEGTIHYHCSNHNERKLSCNRFYKFNGKKTDKSIFTFVIDKK